MLRSLFRIMIFFSILAAIKPVAAQSFYSTHGFGLTNYFISGKSIGMGGTGLAVFEDMSQNYLNPATLSALSSTTISGNFVHETVDLTSATDKAAVTNTNVQGVQFSFPIQTNRAAFAMGLMPFSFIGYAAQGDGDQDGKTYTEEVSGTGGLNAAFVSLAISPFRMVTLGISGLYYFGQLRNLWQVDFTPGNPTDAPDVRDEVSQTVKGPNYRLGITVRLTPKLYIAAIYSPSQALKNKKYIQLVNRLEFSDFIDDRVDLPRVFGVGTSFLVTRKLQLALDFYTEQWSKTDMTEQGYINDSRRVGIGIDFSPRRFSRQFVSSSYWSRVAYRIGFYYRDLGLEAPAQEKVTEIFGTIGLGLPIKSALARFDFSLEVGKRGSKTSNPFEEMVVRFTGSVTVGERWFQRRTR
jgi:hypothetical protein